MSVVAPLPTVHLTIPSSAPVMVPASAAAQKAIQAVDLSMVRMKLMDREEGEGWSAEFADKLVAEYRKFLLLTKTYPNLGIVPAKLVDKVSPFRTAQEQGRKCSCWDRFHSLLVPCTMLCECPGVAPPHSGHARLCPGLPVYVRPLPAPLPLLGYARRG